MTAGETRDSLITAMTEDYDNCQKYHQSACTYDRSVFLSGAIGSEGVVYIIMMVFLVSIAFTYLDIHAQEKYSILKATQFYDSFAWLFRIMYVVLIGSFICVIISVSELVIIKEENPTTQNTAYYISMATMATLAIPFIYILYAFIHILGRDATDDEMLQDGAYTSAIHGLAEAKDSTIHDRFTGTLLSYYT